MGLPPLRILPPVQSLWLALLATGCSGTSFGDRLAASFPGPGATLQAGVPVVTQDATATDAGNAPAALPQVRTITIEMPDSEMPDSGAVGLAESNPEDRATDPGEGVDAAASTAASDSSPIPQQPPEVRNGNDTRAAAQPADQAVARLAGPDPGGAAFNPSGNAPSLPDRQWRATPVDASIAVPYRLLLWLPAVDPSAPSEAVSGALRAAGVRFEVERIERVDDSGGRN